jgi:hypothetical protein
LFTCTWKMHMQQHSGWHIYTWIQGKHVQRTMQDDKIFHPAKLVQTYSKKHELRRRKTHRPIEMTSTHTPCKLINQRGSCKIHDKCKPWCANKENYITQWATEPSKYHQLVKICQAKNLELFSQPDESKRAKKMLELAIPSFSSLDESKGDKLTLKPIMGCFHGLDES